ncbi:MAG: bifunctional aspartate kinase/homoserine dehydrogenase I [Saprospiraceae bacterium]|nr:bifunctional aspartate kinase/homoserine dehydrogenase I [Saprospiraceae bacterium]
MIVLKFGGSSVATPDRIKGILEILNLYYQRGDRFTLVVSAFSGVTDQLIRMSQLAEAGDETYREEVQLFRNRHTDAARALLVGEKLEQVLAAQEENYNELENLLYGIFLLKEVSVRTLDYLLSFGERNSAYLIAQSFAAMGMRSEYLDARQIINTDSVFGSAKVNFELSFSRIQKYYESHPAVQVVTGFIASTDTGQTTTLGRGGSDYTASVLGAALSARQIEIWTDVDGVLTADPRKVRRAFTIPSLTYEEAMEMSHFGAKVIYPPTLVPAMSQGIPVLIKNTFNPKFAGTLISSKADPSGHPVKGVSSITQIALLTLSGGGLFGVPGIAARLFSTLAQSGVNVILITQGSSEHSISFAVSPLDAEKSKMAAEAAFHFERQSGQVDPVRVELNLSIVAVVGENMRYQPGISGRLFESLGRNGVNAVAIAQGSSERNISVVIPAKDEKKALNALHQAFFLSGTKELHLFLVGVGLIGSTLLEQLERQCLFLKENHLLEIKIAGLANSKLMAFSDEGIDPKNWREILDANGESMYMPGFIQKMKEMNLSNTIFVDNTATESVSQYYFDILENSISISTPNKIATSSTFIEYQRLKTVADKRGVQFLYETNVGAGLPVLSTLKDLILSGDKIQKIEGVLSGSLSYIFNSFDGARPFSEIVLEASEKGFTEPDPRIDLGGFDVRRKLIILGREAGYSIESEDVIMPDFLPEELIQADSVEAFFTCLKKHDQYFEQLRAESEAQKKVLRFVGSVLEGRAQIALVSVDAAHPFFALDGSDNMIVFTTDRYMDRPLVIRGPGAGADVTAAGVFAEIIKIGNLIS